jgi:hypothetical protein
LACGQVPSVSIAVNWNSSFCAVNMRVGPSPGCAAERPRIGWSIM